MSSQRSDDDIIALLMNASGAMKEANFEAALGHFNDILAETTNSNVDKFKAAILGMKAECLFSIGRPSEAVEPALEAIKLSEEDKDDEGVVTSLVNLYEIYRYSDKPQEAIEVCKRLSSYFNKLGKVAPQKNYESQAVILAKGEPLNRVVVVIDGQNFEISELASSPVSVRNKSVEFNFLRNKISLPPSKFHCNIAAELTGKGEYASAVHNLLKASQCDPFDPAPWYDLGLAYLHLEKIDDAINAFNKTKELAPGWFDVNHLSWIAQSMKNGKFDLQIFQVLNVLEHGRLTPPQKIQACERLLTVGQKLPVLMLHLGMTYQQVPGKAESAENAFRGGLLLVDELDDDIKTRLLFNLAVSVNSEEEKNTLLKEAQELAGNLTASAMAAVTLTLGKPSN